MSEFVAYSFYAMRPNFSVRRHTNVATLLRAALGGLLAAYLAYVVLAGLRSGVMRTRVGLIHRRKQPFQFWSTAVLFSAMAGACASFAVWILIRQPP